MHAQLTRRVNSRRFSGWTAPMRRKWMRTPRRTTDCWGDDRRCIVEGDAKLMLRPALLARGPHSRQTAEPAHKVHSPQLVTSTAERPLWNEADDLLRLAQLQHTPSANEHALAQGLCPGAIAVPQVPRCTRRRCSAAVFGAGVRRHLVGPTSSRPEPSQFSLAGFSTGCSYSSSQPCRISCP